MRSAKLRSLRALNQRLDAERREAAPVAPPPPRPKLTALEQRVFEQRERARAEASAAAEKFAAERALCDREASRYPGGSVTGSQIHDRLLADRAPAPPTHAAWLEAQLPKGMLSSLRMSHTDEAIVGLVLAQMTGAGAKK